MKTPDIAERPGALFSNSDLNKLIRPLIIEQLLSISVGMFDTMMISSVGNNAVSGVSLVDMINVLIINIFGALATGGAVICSHQVGLARVSEGKKDYSAARHSAKQLMVVLLVISAAVAALCFFFRGAIIGALYRGSEPTLDAYGKTAVDHADIYFAISTLTYPFIALYNGFAALFRTMGNSRVTMSASLIVNLVNIGGNALLIYVFDMQVAGAAIATAVARFLAMAILGVLIMNKKHIIYIDFREKFRLELATIKRILCIGVPSGFENSVFNLGRILTIAMVTSFGETQLAANSVANNLDQLSVVPGSAIGLAMITVVGQCIGAGDCDAAFEYHRKLMKKSYIYMWVLGGGLILTLPLTLRLYGVTYDAKVIAWMLILIHVGVGFLMWPASFVRANALRAAKDVKFTMIVSISSILVFRLVLSYIIGVQMGVGIVGVWIAMLVDWLFRSVMFGRRIYSGRWLSKIK